MTNRSRPVPDSPLTNPRSLGSSLAFHGLLWLLASLVALSVVAPEDTPRPRVLHAELAPVDNRAPAVPGGGGPGELGGVGPPIRLTAPPSAPTPDENAVADPVAAALLDELLPGSVAPEDLTLDAPLRSQRGVGVIPGPGLGGGGGSGGGSGGGIGRGVGPSTEFFGLREHAGSFAYVIDRSGSMSQHHALDLAKEELLASLSQLPPDARFIVLFYNLETTRIEGPSGQTGLLPATGANTERVRARLAQVEASGGTDHVRALRAAFESGAEVVFFLTDAQQMSAEDAERLRAAAGSARIQAVLFGIGPDPGTPDPLKQLARATGGGFRYVDVLTRRRDRP